MTLRLIDVDEIPNCYGCEKKFKYKAAGKEFNSFEGYMDQYGNLYHTNIFCPFNKDFDETVVLEKVLIRVTGKS